MCKIHLSTGRRKSPTQFSSRGDTRHATDPNSDTAVDKYFEALTESYDAIIDAIKAGNERGYRISNNLLAEAQRGQREPVELGKKFAEDPTDVGGFYRAADGVRRPRPRAARSSWPARCSMR